MSPAAPARTWRQVGARVHAHRDAGAGHRWLELTVPRGFREPKPGEFVQLLLAEPSGVFLPRPMSVASVARRGGALAIGFLYAPIGAGTKLLAALEAGASVDVLGPLGRGFPLEHAGVPVLVAGGRGVAPLLFAAEALARGRRRGAVRSIEFVFGARSKAQLVGLAEARRGVRAAGGRLHLATDDGSAGIRGTVLDALDVLAPRLSGPPVLHACGPHGMLRAIAEWALARNAPAFLAMESVMACGIGVCRGCPLPRAASARAAFDPERTPSLFGNREYAMCCTEGPVFDARDLDWERVE
jgi:dihydroorotate dehydrogenase electron transfer subunit